MGQIVNRYLIIWFPEYYTGICTSGIAEHDLHAILNAYCRICLFSRIVLKSSLYRNSGILDLLCTQGTEDFGSRLGSMNVYLIQTWSELWPLSGDSQVPGAGCITHFLTTAEIWSLRCTHNEGWDFNLAVCPCFVYSSETYIGAQLNCEWVNERL